MSPFVKNVDRCRQKKKEEQKRMEERLGQLSAENPALESAVAKKKQELRHCLEEIKASGRELTEEQKLMIDNIEKDGSVQ